MKYCQQVQCKAACQAVLLLLLHTIKEGSRVRAIVESSERKGEHVRKCKMLATSCRLQDGLARAARVSFFRCKCCSDADCVKKSSFEKRLHQVKPQDAVAAGAEVGEGYDGREEASGQCQSSCLSP